MKAGDTIARTQIVTSGMSRRLFLRNSLVGAAGLTLGGGLLSACSSSSKSSSSPPASSAAASQSLADVSVQLEWIENYNWAGMYIAESKGYYTDAGVKVSLIAGGPSITPTTVVLGGKALVGMAGADVVSEAILKGAPFKIFATQYQTSPYVIMSEAKDPVRKPQDLVGRTVGVASEDLPSFDAFLAIAGVDKSKVKTLPLGDESAPDFKSGQITASLDFFDAPIELRQAGMTPYTFNLSEFGYNVVSDSYFALESTIADEADKLLGLLWGDSRGWAEEVKDPAEGATLGVTVYGKNNGLVLANEIAYAKIQNGIVSTPETAKLGLLSLGPQLIEQNIKSLQAGGIDITAAKLFDDSIITELYHKHPELLSVS